MAMIWFAGVLLFCTWFLTDVQPYRLNNTNRVVNVHVTTVYDPFHPFNGVAGVGPFNGSFIGDTLNNTGGAITYQVLVYAYNFVTNSQFSVTASGVSCPATCDSYILPGALWSLDRAPPGNPSTDAIVTIYNAPAIQMDFMQDVSGVDEFHLKGPDCTLYGENGNEVGIIFCLAKSKLYDGWITAGE
jgi:hypothetical protein